ncbi:WW domain-binding protein 4 isoform X1 [Ostrinia nubilalis]|uniref:WW domain-binding protein 4 isoform X1 n=1 Tax=Ostrinia nubilalis TaxID=29057 RepID=UPI0030825EA5
MTEYWKSQARKYCEFCKCWFADNKVSISFHENGKRHKENVEKHISQLSKKSAKDFKQKEKMDDDIKKMEAAAMSAYLKDVQNNADLTSKNINDMLGKNSDTNEPIVVEEPTCSAHISVGCQTPPPWVEVKAPNGMSYYWNVVSHKTTWECPPNGEYVSIEEQQRSKEKQNKVEREKARQNEAQRQEVLKEVNARIAREKMRELAVPAPVNQLPKAIVGPVSRTRPLGDWTPLPSLGRSELAKRARIAREIFEYLLAEGEAMGLVLTPRAQSYRSSWSPVRPAPEKIDLQLPKTKEQPPPPVVVEPEEIKFGERRVTSLGDPDEPVEFKRRKIGNRNARQKLDDD